MASGRPPVRRNSALGGRIDADGVRAAAFDAQGQSAWAYFYNRASKRGLGWPAGAIQLTDSGSPPAPPQALTLGRPLLVRLSRAGGFCGREYTKCNGPGKAVLGSIIAAMVIGEKVRPEGSGRYLDDVDDGTAAPTPTPSGG